MGAPEVRLAGQAAALGIDGSALLYSSDPILHACVVGQVEEAVRTRTEIVNEDAAARVQRALVPPDQLKR